MGELQYMPYTERQREDAAAWLEANDRRLYTAGIPMAKAAAEFSEHIGYRVTGHFLGRVAAKLRKARQTHYAGIGVSLPETIWTNGYSAASWGGIIGACRWLLREEGADLPDEYIARRIADGLKSEDGRVRFARMPRIPVEAIRLARATLGDK